MFIEPTITWVPSGFSRYIWLDHKNCVKKKSYMRRSLYNIYDQFDHMFFRTERMASW